MKYRLWLRGLLSISLIIVCAPCVQAHPAMFSDDSLTQAKEHASTDHKLLLVDFTASWCGPCKRMDATTWSDPLVEQWVKINAIAIQVDVDQDKDTADALKINSMPTIVVFTSKDYSTPFDRQSGYKTSRELLDWLHGVELGKSSESNLEDDALKVMGKGGTVEVQTRYKWARQLLMSGKYAEATDQFVWLWKNIPKEDPPMIGVRGSFMASEMKRLVAKYPDAKARFSELRLDAEKSENRPDWIDLNEVLNEQAKTLSWFDSVKDQPGQQEVFERVDFMLEPLLIRANRWADIGAFLYKDPMKKLSNLHDFSVSLTQFNKKHQAEIPKSSPAHDYDPFPEGAATIYAALLAAGREDDAQKLVTESFRLADGIKLRQELATQAYRAHQTRQAQLTWLEQVPASSVKDVDFYWNRAYVYSLIHQYELALKDYDQAIRIGPPNAQLYFSRAWVFLQTKKYSEAVDDLTHSLQLEPKSADILMTRGYASYMLHHDEAALADFEQAQQLDPKNAWLWINKSAVLYHQRKYPQAYETASRAIELDPKNIGGFCNRGEASFKLEHYQDALDDLNKSIYLNDLGKSINYDSTESKAEAYYYRALVYDRMGKPDLAAQDRKMTDQLGGFTPDDATK